MQRICGWCRWCRDAVYELEPRYHSGTATLHAACMEEYLQETVGLRRLAQLAGFEYREEETDDET